MTVDECPECGGRLASSSAVGNRRPNRCPNCQVRLAHPAGEPFAQQPGERIWLWSRDHWHLYFEPQPDRAGDLPPDPLTGDRMDAIVSEELVDLLGRIGFYDHRPACGCWGTLTYGFDSHGYPDVRTVQFCHQCGKPDEDLF